MKAEVHLQPSDLMLIQIAIGYGVGWDSLFFIQKLSANDPRPDLYRSRGHRVGFAVWVNLEGVLR